MEIIGLKHLSKYQKRNKGNKVLNTSIKAFEKEVKNLKIENLSEVPSQWDKVHNDGFYFIDITGKERLLALVEVEDNELTILWFDDHVRYETIFRNNKNTIEKWLRARGHVP
jgi:mRNA interferase HigB